MACSRGTCSHNAGPIIIRSMLELVDSVPSARPHPKNHDSASVDKGEGANHRRLPSGGASPNADLAAARLLRYGVQQGAAVDTDIKGGRSSMNTP